MIENPDEVTFIAVSVLAVNTNTGSLTHTSLVLVATAKDNPQEMAMEKAKITYPPDKGYAGHSVSTARIDLDKLIAMRDKARVFLAGDNNERTLRELAPRFNDVSTSAPYLWAEVEVKLKIFINHPDTEEGVSQDCIVQIEAPGPAKLSEGEDPVLVGYMEKNVTSLVIDGIETASPLISLDDVIKAFSLDVDTPIWHIEEE